MLASSTSRLHDPGREELANMLGATGSFCCRLNRFRVVATTIADGARAMATIAARVLQASIDSPTRWCFLARCRRLIIVDVSDAYGRICGLPVLHRSRVDRRERGSQLEQSSMGMRSAWTVVVVEGRRRPRARRRFEDTGFAATFYLLAFLSSGSLSVLSGVQTGRRHACQCCGSESRERRLALTPA